MIIRLRKKNVLSDRVNQDDVLYGYGCFTGYAGALQLFGVWFDVFDVLVTKRCFNIGNKNSQRTCVLFNLKQKLTILTSLTTTLFCFMMVLRTSPLLPASGPLVTSTCGGVVDLVVDFDEVGIWKNHDRYRVTGEDSPVSEADLFMFRNFWFVPSFVH